MSFIWPGFPSARATSCEYADYIEITCLRDGYASLTSVLNQLGKLEDNDYEDGVEFDSVIEESLDAALAEMDSRSRLLGEKYPFILNEQGTGVNLEPKIVSSHFIYVYLLLSTRFNMKSNKIQNEIDSTLFFEKVCSVVAKNYFGKGTESLVFGTGDITGKGFEEKVELLIRRIGEGGKFMNRDPGPVSKKDAGVDVIAWKPFKDKKFGKLIGFGQCKTGRSWKNHVSSMQPSAFIKTWFQDSFAVNPTRMFFICESVSSNQWYENSVNAGIIFDRERIMNFEPSYDQGILDECKNWLKGSFENSQMDLENCAFYSSHFRADD